MKDLRTRFLALVLCCAMEIALAQIDPQIQKYRNEPQGNVQNRKIGIMSGNRIKTIFLNDGEVGHWPDEPSAEWPKGTEHSYLDGTALLIASKIIAPNGQTITPLVSAYREVVSKDPLTGEEWVLQPVSGYTSAQSTTPALSIDTSSWPNTWPDALNLSSDWNGQWYGYFGKGMQAGLTETFYVLDDSKVKKWTRPPFNYYPITEDSTRTGLGLRVEVRGLQWADSLVEDMLFWHYNLINISDYDYDTSCVGLYIDPGVGGTNILGNSGEANRQLNMFYSWCPTCGLGTPSPTNYKAGYIGFSLLNTPQNVGLTALTIHTLDGSHGPTGLWIENDAIMWNAMNNGFRDTIVQNSNIHVVMGAGPFTWKKWKTKSLTSVILFASDFDTLVTQKLIAQRLYDSLMRVIDNPTIVQIENRIPSNFYLEDNFPNPFNPSTNIAFSLPASSWTVLKIYDLIGREVAIPLQQYLYAGVHSVTFDARDLPSGCYFYALTSGNYRMSKKMLLLK